MKRLGWIKIIALVCGWALALNAPASAQEPDLRLSLRKEFGFALGGQIQGTFRLTAQGPEDLASVTFKIGDQTIGQVDQPPFSLRFNTDAYPPGHYELSAVGQTADGRAVQSNVLRVEFVSAEAGWQAMSKIMLPLLILVGLIFVAATLGPFVLERLGKKPRALPLGAPRDYGVLGGAICPKCQRPFGLHWWAPNLIASKLDRCPHCGKWSVVGRASREALAAAQAAELQAAAPETPELDAEEKLRRQIQESRYL